MLARIRSGVKQMKMLMIISLISIYACHETQDMTANKIEKDIQAKFELPSSEYVILSSHSDLIFKAGEPTNLNQAELIEIEQILKLAIKENNEEQKLLLKNHNEQYPQQIWSETGFELKIDGFKRQYVPIINEQGEKEIWINFFCDDWGNEDWKNELMEVDDGGNCYFNLKVNITKKSYSELYINGYA